MHSEKFEAALLHLQQLYAGDYRKGTGAPTLCHVLRVMDLVTMAGADDETAIAAGFHDSIEDKGGVEMEKRLAFLYGPNISRIVRDCSDTDETPKPSWYERKIKHLAKIPSLEADSRLVLAADTLDNTQNHIMGFKRGAIEWFGKFRAQLPDTDDSFESRAKATLWYLTSKSDALCKQEMNILTSELADEVSRLSDYLQMVDIRL
jgi:hypothetical protein